METVAISTASVNRSMMTIIENQKNLQEGWYRRVEMTLVDGEWKSEAWAIHAETGNREFRGCSLLETYEEAMDKAYEWVDYIEFYYF